MVTDNSLNVSCREKGLLIINMVVNKSPRHPPKEIPKSLKTL